MVDGSDRVALVWRGEPGTAVETTRNFQRLAPFVESLARAGVVTESVLYDERLSQSVRDRLLGCSGVLVWVDPFTAERDRRDLDRVLREVASRGVWVSAHPDTIDKIGTKEVLFHTRHLGWGIDTDLYGSAAAFRDRFPTRIRRGHARVLKQHRGNGGAGVWKVTLVDDDVVRVQHAAPRDDRTDDLPLSTFMDRCDPWFEQGGTLIDQAFAERLPEGLIRAYLVGSAVVGFARQQPADPGVDPTAPAPDRVLGLPSAKTMHDEDEPQFAPLRDRLEREWVPALCRVVGLAEEDLPLLWDADFLLGTRTPSGDDTYVLCEINASSVIPFPRRAPDALARAAAARRPAP